MSYLNFREWWDSVGINLMPKGDELPEHAAIAESAWYASIEANKSIPDVACGRIKECEHFLGLTEKLSWLKDSDEHNLFVSMIKMRIEFLKQDDNVKKAMTDTLEELINESKPST